MKRMALALVAILGSGWALHAQGVLQGTDPCATAPATCATTINTHAIATRRLPNTVVDVSLGIAVNGRDLLTVQHDLAARSGALLGWLRGQKVERLMTMDVSFTPETKTRKNATDKTVGYNGSEQVTFEVTQEKAPELLGGVIDHGATSIDRTEFTPTEMEIEVALRELSIQATKAAIGQAETVAGAAGLKVVAVKNIAVEAPGRGVKSQTRGFVEYEMKQNAPASPVATQAGDASLSISVDVTVAAAR